VRIVKVKSILMDPTDRSPVLLLEEENGKIIPIWVDNLATQSILMILKGEEIRRPVTHDLIQDTVTVLGGQLEQVLIDGIQGGIFYAKLKLRDSLNNLHELDCRPSDAVALAVRENSSIFVSEAVYKAAAIEVEEEE